MLSSTRKTQAQGAYEILGAEGFRVFIGTKPHNSHIVSVFTTARKAVVESLNRGLHHPVFEVKKIKGRDVIMLYFTKR